MERGIDRWAEVRQWLNPEPVARDRKIGLTTLAVGAAVTVFLFHVNLNPLHPLPFEEYNLLNTGCILWIPLLVILLILRREPSEFGMAVGDASRGLAYVAMAMALFTPVLLVVASQPDSQGYYVSWMGTPPMGSGALAGVMWNGRAYQGGEIIWSRLLFHEFVMGFYMFGWEFYYRGFLLNGLRRLLPLWPAILLQAAFFLFLHYGKPIPEMLSSFPGGIVMALLALRCRSFVPCFLLHALISAGFDFAVLYAHFHH